MDIRDMLDEAYEQGNKMARQILEPMIPKWKSYLEPPLESGRYWCYVQEINSISTSHFQWNCSYDANSNTWMDNLESVTVKWWTELLPNPE